MKVLTGFQAIMVTVLMALMISGCTQVTMQYPLKASPTPVDKEKFEGTWLGGDGEGTLTVRFASSGIARFAGVDWKNEQFEMIQGEMIVSEGKKHNFLSVRIQDKGVWENRYYLAQYFFNDQGDLVLRLPDFKMFEAAITRKQLQGIIKESDITITSAPDELLKVLNDPANHILFEVKEPVIFRRIGKQLKAK